MPEYGFAHDGTDFWESCFSTREDAIAAAHDWDAARPFQTAIISPIPLEHPNYAESCCDWLINNGGNLGNWLVDALTGANEDGDFEGEFSDACNRVNRRPISDAGRKALGVALRRLGGNELAAVVEAGEMSGPFDIPDTVAYSIAGDRALHIEIREAVQAWIEVHELGQDLRGLRIAEIMEHRAASDFWKPLPFPVLPIYTGPSHHLDALERLAVRETCQAGIAWADLTNNERNSWLVWASQIISYALSDLRLDPLTRGSPIISRGVYNLADLDWIEAWVENRLGEYRYRAGSLSRVINAITGGARS